jgi:hypothetical protein
LFTDFIAWSLRDARLHCSQSDSYGLPMMDGW